MDKFPALHMLCCIFSRVISILLTTAAAGPAGAGGTAVLAAWGGGDGGGGGGDWGGGGGAAHNTSAAAWDLHHAFYNGTLLLVTPYNETYGEDYYEALYAVPSGLIVLLSFLYGSISVLAVVGNLLVMWIVATARRMQNVTNCYIANLALADIVIGLFAIPFQFQAALLQRWVLPNFMCAFCPFVQALSVNVSVFTLTAVAVDRHRAILTPLSARPSKRIAKGIIGCIWLVALSLAIPMAMSWEVIMDDDRDPVTKIYFKKPFCVPSEFGSNSLYSYRLVLFLSQYLTPLCIISCAYARMALKLWGSKAPGNAQDSRDATIMKNKKKVIKMLAIVVSLFALCWLPLQTYYLLQTYFPSINEYKYINIVFFCFDWLAMSNSCYNPFIYGIYNEKFKREFKQRFPFCRNHRNKALATDSFDIDKNPSFQTRMSSFRSTCESRRYSTRLPPAPLPPPATRRRRSAVEIFSFNKETAVPPRGASVHRQKLSNNIKTPNGKKTNEVDTLFSLEEGLRRCGEPFGGLGPGCGRELKGDSLDSSSIEEERVTEMYIFPNSNIIELKEAIQERKL